MSIERAVITTPQEDLTPTYLSNLQRLLRTPGFWAGLCLLVGLLLLSYIGPILDPNNPLAINPARSSLPPSWSAPMGTDVLGRSELARVMAGGQQLIGVGLASAFAATVGGAVVGFASGFWGGFLDRVLSWVMDVVLGIPQLLPLLILFSLLRPHVLVMTIVVSATLWPVVGRVVRAETMSLRARDFVAAAASLGAGGGRIIVRHLFPNLWGSILIAYTNLVATAVLVLGTASFLGLGLPPPWPNWASMLAASAGDISSGQWWLMLFPGMGFVVFELSIYFLTESLAKTFYAQGGNR